MVTVTAPSTVACSCVCGRGMPCRHVTCATWLHGLQRTRHKPWSPRTAKARRGSADVLYPLQLPHARAHPVLAGECELNPLLFRVCRLRGLDERSISKHEQGPCQPTEHDSDLSPAHGCLHVDVPSGTGCPNPGSATAVLQQAVLVSICPATQQCMPQQAGKSCQT